MRSYFPACQGCAALSRSFIQSQKFNPLSDRIQVISSVVRFRRRTPLRLGIGPIIGVFFRLTPVRAEIDTELWIILGDVPPAYIVCDIAQTC